MFARTFVGSAAAIILFELILIVIASAGVVLPSGVLVVPIEGFSQNRNAFSFGMILAICALPLLPQHVRTMALAIVVVGLWFAGSRAAIGAAAIVVGLIGYLKVLSIRQVSLAFLGFVIALLIIAAIPIVAEMIYPGWIAPSPYLRGVPVIIDSSILDSSNLQRLKSMADGLSLFFSHPIFGVGLGVYMDEQIKSGTALVIHSTPIWLLAENGVIGFAAFVIPAALIFGNAWRARQSETSAQTVVLSLVTFAVMSSVHELLYQRTLWLVLGVSLALAVKTSRD